MSMIAFHGDASLKVKAIADFDGLFPPRDMELHDGRKIPMLITPDDWEETTGIPAYLFELARTLRITRATMLEVVPVGSDLAAPLPLGVGGRYLLSAFKNREIHLERTIPIQFERFSMSRIERICELIGSGKSRVKPDDPSEQSIKYNGIDRFIENHINDVVDWNSVRAYSVDDPVIATRHILTATGEFAARASVAEPWMGVDHYERNIPRFTMNDSGDGQCTVTVVRSYPSGWDKGAPREAFNARHEAVREILAKILLCTLAEAA